MNLASRLSRISPRITVTENRRLSDLTTFRLGGPCPLLIEGAGPTELPAVIQLLNSETTPFLVIGQGSNLVISDSGLACAVIRFCSDSPSIEADGRRITVSGNTLLDDFAQFTTENEIGDLTFCTGIPGTVGGAVAGNAGAFGRQVGDHLLSAELLDADGRIQTVRAEELEFAYRHSRLKESGEILLSATFELPPESPETLRAERRRILQFRREHHPDWRQTPCAGSFFRNIEPTSSAERRKAAGWFLEEAGTKQLQAGGARIYEKHANIIVADAGCTAEDVRSLSDQMIAAVREKFGFTLQREVRFLGRF